MSFKETIVKMRWTEEVKVWKKFWVLKKILKILRRIDTYLLPSILNDCQTWALTNRKEEEKNKIRGLLLVLNTCFNIFLNTRQYQKILPCPSPSCCRYQTMLANCDQDFLYRCLQSPCENNLYEIITI